MKFSNHYKMGYLIWEKMAANDMQLRKRLFCLGNLVPDLTGSFMFRLHSYSSCGMRLKKLMRRLFGGSFVRNGILFSFYSGVMSHYICDFLCFPHTTSFKGNLREHRLYEKSQVVKAEDMLPFNRQISMNYSYSELILCIEDHLDRREQMLVESISASTSDIPLAVHVAIWAASAIYLRVGQVSELEAMPSQLFSA